MSAIAKIAVSAATYWLDRPYDYKIPRELEEKALPGVSVYVPFSNGNRRTEGVILALAEETALRSRGICFSSASVDRALARLATRLTSR